ncbi:MAG: hypothetical protein M3O28_11270, partial [Actinomycetota bacterium]|nr:hypothetical protein [Actinomycetota bacterium]
PGIAGEDAFTNFTTPIGTQATRLMPAGGTAALMGPYPPTGQLPPARRRSAWTWPLIAIVAVLAVTLIAIIIVLLVRPTGSGTAPTTSPATSKTPTSKPSTPTPTPTATSIDLNPSDYVGKSFNDVQSSLLAQGFGLFKAVGPVADSPSKNGTVSSINPYGNQPKGAQITVSVFQDYPGPPAPSAAPNVATGSHNSGDTVAIGWTAYGSCPTGFPLSAYNVTLSNATFAPGSSSPFGASTTSANIILGSVGTATISYTVTCGTGSAALTSGASPNATVTVN